ncbi:MAG: XkdQ/YqbQ family protein [Solirubrobacteraceae bacterium]
MATRRTTKDRRGREQRRRTAAARARRPDLSRYYGRKMEPVSPGEFEFELTLLRGAGVASLNLDAVVESFEWTDEETAMAGSLQLRRPEPGDRASLPIGRGHRVRCRVRWAGRWYELWTMRVEPPETDVQPDGVTVTVTLVDDLDLVKRGRRRYLRRTRKRRRYGYFGHAVIREEARKEGIKLGALVKCTKRMAKIDVTGSFLDLVVKVYEHEREKTGRRFVIRMRNGRLEVVTYRRNRMLYVLAEELRSAGITQEPKVEKPVTVLVGKGRTGKGSGGRKVRHTEYRRDMVRRFGYSRKVKDYGRIGSLGELRSKVRSELAKQYRVDTKAAVQHQGIPFIRQGDGAQLVLRSEGFTGKRSYVFCTGGRHQVQGASYTSHWTFVQEDPFAKDREEREKEARERRRKQRQRRRR